MQGLEKKCIIFGKPTDGKHWYMQIGKEQRQLDKERSDQQRIHSNLVGNEICSSEPQRIWETVRTTERLKFRHIWRFQAYDILEELKHPGGKVMPPTVYRAMDFWIEHGFVHRIESLNAYFACGHPLHKHGCQLLVCLRCNRVLEVCDHELQTHFAATAGANHYEFERAVLEIHGVCPACQTS